MRHVLTRGLSSASERVHFFVLTVCLSEMQPDVEPCGLSKFNLGHAVIPLTPRVRGP